MNWESVGTLCLMGMFLYFSIDFHKHYTKEFHDAARNPILRLLAGLFVICIANINPVLGCIALSIVFFWIADVQLLSTIVL
jgi:hypothetical protein